MSTFTEYFLAGDYAILHLFNVDWASPISDQFWKVITHLDRQPLFMMIGLPLLILIPLLIYRLSFLKVLAVLALTVGISDFAGTHLLKHVVDRQRPFQNAEISKQVIQKDDAHGPSFPSNHAANCFAGAVILAYYFKKRRHVFYIFATLVAISRVALGLHYPSDVIGGAILGLCVGYMVRSFLLNRLGVFQSEKEAKQERVESEGWRTRVKRLDDF